ncbi:hypothetical protein OG689_10635 [Kitasatospora sp. NBC_00240]|nr:hypothetical protein [Kitasatospora sp. NBC_00240]MCX5209739.1 hypothetical protein [Kitasatospora sp. NBC_00240]
MTGPELAGLLVVLTAITAVLGTLGWDLRRLPGRHVIAEAEAITKQAAE